MTTLLAFPTRLHQQTAELARDFFLPRAAVDTVLVVNSCARGQATPESDLDMAILVKPETPAAEAQVLLAGWQALMARHPLIAEYQAAGRFRYVHLDVITGQYAPAIWDEGGGPDAFEIEIGNQVARSAPLHSPGPYFRDLQARWLPFYADDLWRQRAAMTRAACAYDLACVDVYAGRGLHFQAFDRLYKGFQEFLQALFISRRVYPIAYNKWIREQVETWLDLPALYRQLPGILSVSDIESDALKGKAAALQALLEAWAPA